MEMLLMLGLVALAGGAPLVVLGTARLRAASTSNRATLEYLGEGAAPVAEPPVPVRLLAPVARRLTPAGYARALAAKLSRAGDTRSVDQLLVVKAAGGAAGVALGLWAGVSNPGPGALIAVVAGAAGCFAPDVMLRRRIEARAAAVRTALPDSLDLMAILVEAGVGLEGAIARAAEDCGGPLGEEYRRLLHEMRLGSSRREAFHALKERVDVPEISSFVVALLQADALGMSVGRVLKSQATEMRSKRRQRAREQAAKTPVKILFPLVFGIFPALLIVVLGPAAIRIMGTVFGG